MIYNYDDPAPRVSLMAEKVRNWAINTLRMLEDVMPEGCFNPAVCPKCSAEIQAFTGRHSHQFILRHLPGGCQGRMGGWMTGEQAKTRYTELCQGTAQPQ